MIKPGTIIFRQELSYEDPSPLLNRPKYQDNYFNKLWEWAKTCAEYRKTASYHYYPVKDKKTKQRKHKLYENWLIIHEKEELTLITPLFFKHKHNIETIPNHWLPFQIKTTQGPAATLLNRARLIPKDWLELCKNDIIAETHDVKEIQKKWRKLLYG